MCRLAPPQNSACSIASADAAERASGPPKSGWAAINQAIIDQHQQESWAEGEQKALMAAALQARQHN
jgi:hypothetical protein